MHASSSPRVSSQEAEPDTWLRHTGFMPKCSQQKDGNGCGQRKMLSRARSQLETGLSLIPETALGL